MDLLMANTLVGYTSSTKQKISQGFVTAFLVADNFLCVYLSPENY